MSNQDKQNYNAYRREYRNIKQSQQTYQIHVAEGEHTIQSVSCDNSLTGKNESIQSIKMYSRFDIKVSQNCIQSTTTHM
jgi:hypothetical protein